MSGKKIGHPIADNKMPSALTFLGIPLRENVERRHMAGAMLAVTVSMFSLLFNVVIFQKFLIDHVGIPENIVATQRGYLTIIYNLVYLATAPFWGMLSDRLGRRSVAAGCFGLTAIGFWLLGLTHSFRTAAGANILIGFSASGGMASCMAAAADYTVPKYRGRLMGTIGTLIGVGASLGIFTGFTTYAIYYYLTFFLQGVGYVCSAIIVLSLLKRGSPSGQKHAHGHGRSSGEHPKVSVRRFLQAKLVLAYLSAFLLGGTMQLAVTVFYPWGELKMKMSHGALSGITGTGSLVFTMLAIFAGMLVLRIGRLRLIFIGIAGFCVSMFLSAIGTSPWTVSSAYILAWGFYACIYPVSLAFATTMVPSWNRGLSMGIYHGMRATGEIAFLLSCPFLYESVGGKFASFMLPAVISLGLAGFALVLLLQEGVDGVFPEPRDIQGNSPAATKETAACK